MTSTRWSWSFALGAACLALVFVFAGSTEAGQVGKTSEIKLGPYMNTLKPGDGIEASIERGQKLFNQLGCAGCHPRGGTIGGTAVDATGNRMNIPIPDLHGAALHDPRIAASGFVATIGIMNDL
jgi:hypothetical protein